MEQQCWYCYISISFMFSLVIETNCNSFCVLCGEPAMRGSVVCYLHAAQVYVIRKSTCFAENDNIVRLNETLTFPRPLANSKRLAKSCPAVSCPQEAIVHPWYRRPIPGNFCNVISRPHSIASSISSYCFEYILGIFKAAALSHLPFPSNTFTVVSVSMLNAHR
jgi:hypothetical protein